jgi:predicted hydrocarbon binding protein
MSFLIKSEIKILWQKIFYNIEHDIPTIRPNLGDYVNTVEVQKRLDYVLFYNPNIIRTEYLSTLDNTKENIDEYHKSKGLDHAMFRNFSRHDEAQGLKILQVINKNIYRPIFVSLGKGFGMVRGVKPLEKRVSYEVRKCNECMDLPNIGLHSCFFFAGILAGIFTAIFRQPMGVYESVCRTSGGETCDYEIGMISDEDFEKNVDKYLNIKVTPEELDQVETLLLEKIRKLLSSKDTLKPNVGTDVHIMGYQLRILNALATNPEIMSNTYRKAGIRFSNKFEKILREVYHVNGEKILTEALPQYYKKQRLANIHSVEKFQDGFMITFTEPLDCAGIKKLDIKPCAFMQGEIEGITNIATGKTSKCEIQSCRYDTKEKFCQYRISYEVKQEDVPEWLKELQDVKENPVA